MSGDLDSTRFPEIFGLEMPWGLGKSEIFLLDYLDTICPCSAKQICLLSIFAHEFKAFFVTAANFGVL